MFNDIKINRAIATYYNQIVKSFFSTIQIAATCYVLKFVHVA